MGALRSRERGNAGSAKSASAAATSSRLPCPRPPCPSTSPASLLAAARFSSLRLAATLDAAAALNIEATRAVTCAADFSAKVWDAITGDELLDFKHRHIVRAADWSHDSATLVTGGKEAKLRIFDINQPEVEPRILLGHGESKAIKVVRFMPEVGTFLSAGEDKTIRLWDVRTGAQVRQLDFDGSVNSVEISRDKKTMTVAAGNSVSFWDTNSYACIKSFEVCSAAMLRRARSGVP